MPTAPRATPTSTRPASERRRPATARTTAAVAPVSTAANRGCSPVEAEALEGVGAGEGDAVDEGQQRSHARQRGPAGGQAIEAPRQRGRGEAGQDERGGEHGRGADAARQGDHRHREGRAQHDGALGDRGPPEGGGGDHPFGEEERGPVELGVDADGGHVDRHEEGAQVQKRPGGGREGRLQAATGDQAPAGGEQQHTELDRVGDGAPVHGDEHGGGRQEQEGTRAGHPDGAGAGRIRAGWRGGRGHGPTVRRSAAPGGPGGPPRGPWGIPYSMPCSRA